MGQRLIDANRLKALLMVDFMQLELFGQKYKVSDALRTVDNTPTEDAVPVIRCKDCKYAKKIYIKNLPWVKQWEYSCAYFNTRSVMGDGFCSQAEPKERGK